MCRTAIKSSCAGPLARLVFTFLTVFLLAACGESDESGQRGLFAFGFDKGNAGSESQANSTVGPYCIATVYQSQVAVGNNFTLIVDTFSMGMSLQVISNGGGATVTLQAEKILSNSRVAQLYRLDQAQGSPVNSVTVTDDSGNQVNCDYSMTLAN